MKLITSLIFLTLLVSLTVPVQAVVNDLGQIQSDPRPPLKVLGNKQHKTNQPSLPSLLSNRAQMNGANEDIRDIQGPVILPESKNFWIPVAIGALILLLIALIFFLIKKNKKSAPQIPAHEIALAELAKAKAWMNTKKGLFYAQRLSEILRQYIESRFFVQSTRQTTEELLAELQTDSTSNNGIHPHIGDLQVCLERCDMAKFAHLAPDDQSMDEMESSVRDFIETTKPGQPVGETT